MAGPEVIDQSEAIMEDIRQTKAWGEHLRFKGWRVERIKADDGKHTIQIFIYRLAFWPFSMMKMQRSNYDPDFSELKKIRRKYWTVSSVIEPTKINNLNHFKKAGYNLSRFPYLGMSTYINDLQKTDKELWNGLSENARRQIKKNSRVEIEEVSANKFCSLWKECAKIWTMNPEEVDNLLKIFGNKARLVASKLDGKYQSGLMLFYSKDMANYYQTWTNEEGRKSGAHYKLVWEEMLRAKKAGMKYFDFEGVFDERWPQKKWVGFTEFKRRFGGKLVHYPGSFFRWL